MADSDSKAATIAQIRAVKRSYGTTWHLPFQLAMNLNPVPQQIYFLTDGNTRRQAVSDEIIELVTALGEDTKVDTRGLGTDDKSARHLSRISESTGGKFRRV